MFDLFEKVMIKKNGVKGTIVDISESNGSLVFIVESDEKGKRNDGYGGVFPLFDCTIDDIEKA